MKKWLGIAMCVAGAVAVMHWPGTAKADTQTQQDGHKAQNEAKYVEEAFAATGATANGYVIHSWAQLNATFDSMNMIEKIVSNSAQDLSIEHAKVIKRELDHERYYEIQGTLPGGETAAVIVSSLEGGQSSSQTVMVIQEDAGQYHAGTFSTDLAQISRTAHKWTNNPVVSACIEGSTDDRMDVAEENTAISRVFAKVHAKRVEGISTSDVTSISGYSPLGSDFIQTNGHRMNLQVGLHYNDVDHHMNVVVGTPIITITY